MSKLKLLALSLLLITAAHAQTIWLDDRLKTVSEDSATLYMKAPPAQKDNGTWFAEIYSKENNALRISAKLTDPDVTKRQFVDNKFTFYCSATCRQERMIVDNHTTEVWDYFGTGELYRHFFIVNGKVEGTMEIFHGAPSPMRTEEYRADKKHGIERGLRPDGKITSETPYVNGQINGLRHEWNDDAQLIKQTRFKDGERDGQEKRWNAQSILIEEAAYQKGLQHGDYAKWNTLGERLEAGHYAQGKKNGEFSHYSNSDLLRRKEFFKNGQPVGLHEYYTDYPGYYLNESKRYDDQHRLVEHLLYEQDKVLYSKKTYVYKKDIEVSTDTFYRNNQISSQTTKTKNSKTNSTTSVYEEYDDQQRLIRKSEYLNDQLHGTNIDVSYYGNKEVSNYRHGKRHGEILITDKEGKIITKGLYENGVEVGAWQSEGFANGENTVIHENYNKKGARHGSYTEKTADGKVQTSGKYVNGKKTGAWIEHRGLKKISLRYDANGKIHGHYVVMNTEGNAIEEGNYQHGELHGRYIVMNADGKLVEEGNYQNGKLHGRYVVKDDAGHIIKEENYLNGQPHGKFMESINGQVVTQGEYKNNEKHGDWLEYGANTFAQRTDICKGNYQQGLKVGKWQCFSFTDYLKTSVFFDTNGLLQGNGYFFNRIGMLEEVAHYQDGKLDGILKTYDSEGNEFISHYEKGELLPAR